MYGSMSTKCIRCNGQERAVTFTQRGNVKFNMDLLSAEGVRVGSAAAIDGKLCDLCVEDVLHILLDGGQRIV